LCLSWGDRMSVQSGLQALFSAIFYHAREKQGVCVSHSVKDAS